MMRIKRIVLTFIVCFGFYLLPELLFSDTIMYLIGGVVGGTINEIVNFFVDVPDNKWTMFYWIIILVSVIICCIKTKKIFLKYLLILSISFLLYVIDLIFSNTISFDPDVENKIILNTAFKSTLYMVSILTIKSFVLSFVYIKSFKLGNK